eukprot:1142074-Pelagomonas_calceolata.AAC.6
MHPEVYALPACMSEQIWILEKMGGSLVGGSLKLFQDRKNNPPPPRNPQLPPKPKVSLESKSMVCLRVQACMYSCSCSRGRVAQMSMHMHQCAC